MYSLLYHRPDNRHDSSCLFFGRFYRLRLGINPDNRLSIRFSQMYPTIGKIYFHPIYISNLVSGILFFDSPKQGIDIDSGRLIYTMIRNSIRGICSTQFAH